MASNCAFPDPGPARNELATAKSFALIARLSRHSAKFHVTAWPESCSFAALSTANGPAQRGSSATRLRGGAVEGVLDDILNLTVGTITAAVSLAFAVTMLQPKLPIKPSANGGSLRAGAATATTGTDDNTASVVFRLCLAFRCHARTS